MLYRFFIDPTCFFACVSMRATLDLKSLSSYIFLKLFFVESRWPVITDAPDLGTGQDRAFIIGWIDRSPQHMRILQEFEDHFDTRHCTMQWTDEHTATIYQDEGPPFDYTYRNNDETPDFPFSPTLAVDLGVPFLQTQPYDTDPF